MSVENKNTEFDIDRSLEDPKFAEFLTLQTEEVDVNDSTAVEKYFNVWTKKERVKKDLVKIYRETIQEDFDISLGENEFNTVNDEIDRMAVEEPEKVLEYSDKIKRFLELPAEIVDVSKKINDLRGADANLDKAIEENSLAEKAMELNDWGGLVGYYSEYLGKYVPGRFGRVHRERVDAENELTKKLKKKVLTPKDVADHLKATEVKVEQMRDKIGQREAKKTDLDNLVKELDGLGVEIISAIGKHSFIVDKIRSMARDSIRLGEEPTLEELDQKYEIAQKLKENDGKSRTGISLERGPFGGGMFNRPGNISFKDWETDFQDKIQTEIEDRILVATGNISPRSLSELEKALEKYLKRESIGALRGEEAKDFILTTFEKVVSDFSEPPLNAEQKVKSLFLKRILGKMKSK